MEHISEIIKRQTRTSSSKANTDTSSSVDAVPEQVCPVCKGARFVHPLLPDGKPDYYHLVSCECANREVKGKRQTRLQKYSNLGALVRLTFDNYVPEGKTRDTPDREQSRLAYDAATAYAARPADWLVITGPSGSGKTHLAVAIANRCLQNNIPAFYATVPDLLDHLRASFSPSSEIGYDEFFEQVRNATVLILDDFGVQSSSAWAKEKLDQLLSHRYNHRLPTVIVSIVPVEELEERVRTRLLNTEFCRVYSLGSRQPELFLHRWAPGFELQKRMTFENFDWKRANLPLEQRQNLEAAFTLARNYAESPEGWLVFAGVNGCGKTHLAAAIANHRFKHGKPALFIVVPDFLDHLRSTFSPESKVSYDQLFESVRNTELLVLDDFGEQATTPWAQEKLYQVINHRYNANLPTVVTTSSSLEEMDNRIASRFGDHKISTLFNITVPDYRMDRPAHRKSSHLPRKST